MMSDTTFPQRIPAEKPLTMFNHAFQHGWLHHLWAELTRHCFCLLDLDETLQACSAAASHYAGIKTVSIDQIRGTQGKAGEFNPAQARSRSRWIDIALQKLRGRDLPPVELVQIDNIYYVRDGHHRISVSRAMGQNFIDAEITILRIHQQTSLR